MQGKGKNIVKKVVDVCMTVLLLFLIAYQVTGEKWHEWLGVATVVVFVLHHVLNRKWTASLFKGKYNAYRVVTVFATALLLTSDVLTAPGIFASGAPVTLFVSVSLPDSVARR